MRLIPVACLLLSACAPLDGAVNLDRILDVFQPPSRAEVWLDAGDVSVQVGDSTSVERRLRWQGDVRPTSGVRRAGGTLVVDGTCPPHSVGCAVDVDLVLPAEAVLEVFTGSGDVTVSGLSGDVFADTGAGFVDLDALAGRVDVHADEGDVRGTALTGTEARADAGAVDLAFDAPPEVVEVTAGPGDVSLVVPAGAYALDLSAPAGAVVLGEAIESDDASPNRLVALSAAGDVRVSGSDD